MRSGITVPDGPSELATVRPASTCLNAGDAGERRGGRRSCGVGARCPRRPNGEGPRRWSSNRGSSRRVRGARRAGPDRARSTPGPAREDRTVVSSSPTRTHGNSMARTRRASARTRRPRLPTPSTEPVRSTRSARTRLLRMMSHSLGLDTAAVLRLDWVRVSRSAPGAWAPASGPWRVRLGRTRSPVCRTVLVTTGDSSDTPRWYWRPGAASTTVRRAVIGFRANGSPQ
jgi:hypothetical protein